MVPVSLTASAAAATAALGAAASVPAAVVAWGGPHRRADAPDPGGPAMVRSRSAELSEPSMKRPGWCKGGRGRGAAS